VHDTLMPGVGERKPRSKKKRARKGPRRGDYPNSLLQKRRRLYARGDVVLPLVLGGQGVPGDGVIPGDELVLP
jgi:hypothetical protein